MRGTAVQFGAGNIGRGFLAQLFYESDMEVAFIEVAPRLLAALQARSAYQIDLVGRTAHTVTVEGVRVVDGNDLTGVANEVAKAEIVATAVGVHALEAIAPALAAGLLGRLRSDRPALNILLCENLIDAPARLRDAVMRHIPPTAQEAVAARTGFVQAVVSRMVPLQTGTDPLAVRAEAYKRLPIDADALVAPINGIVGVEPVTNFAAHVARKLYTHNCAHAALGYLGHLAGHAYGYEALRDRTIRRQVDAVLDETGRALVGRYGFDCEENRAHMADLLLRFDNEALGDTCRRLARDPIRKLAAGDRLTGAARLCEDQSIRPYAVAGVIAAALRYADPDDPSAPTLQRMLQADGLVTTLRTVCGVAEDEPLAELIMTAASES